MDCKLKFDPHAVTVPVAELVPFMGGSEEGVEYHIRRFKVEVLVDWADRRAIRVADARKIVNAQRAAAEAHSDRWNAYQAWRVAEKDRKARERAKAFAAQRAEAERIRDARRQRAIMEDIATHEAALAAAAEAQGPSFEEWSQAHGGGVTVLTDTPGAL